jgi:hypothetical protein
LKKWSSLLSLLLAGLVAAGRQLVAIGVLALIVRLLLRLQFPDLAAATTSHGIGTSLPDAVTSLLAWMYVFTAAGCALTSDRFLLGTAERMRTAARLMSPTNPTLATKIVFAQCSIGAAALAVSCLTSTPPLIDEFGRFIGSAWLGQLVWPALSSVGAATFGALAHAAYRGLR